ncbi:MAG: hypothetical protein JWM16_6307 [Verrucomicrobiales bacterium]|nr:hypothetical protein [Verrucomicrobiales bacterium]
MSAQAVAERNDNLPAKDVGTTVSTMDMINNALANGASMELVEKLMVLHERWEANQARKAFNEAFAAFKSEVVTIARNRLITDGPLKGRKYAELFSFVDAVTPALSKHGLSASWNITKDEKDWIEVTCTIEHVLGGNKKVAIGGPPDTGGAKNAIQARLSAITYLERGSLKAACGLAEQGDDKDGASPPVEAKAITPEQLIDLRKQIEETKGDTAAFCEHFGIDALPDLRAKDLPAALTIIDNRRKKMGAGK